MQKGIVKSKEWRKTNNGDQYALYDIDGKLYSAFDQCDGEAEVGDAVEFEYKDVRGFRNLTKIFIVIDRAKAYPNRSDYCDPFVGMISNQTQKDLIARNIMTNDANYIQHYLKAFEKMLNAYRVAYGKVFK